MKRACKTGAACWIAAFALVAAQAATADSREVGDPLGPPQTSEESSVKISREAQASAHDTATTPDPAAAALDDTSEDEASPDQEATTDEERAEQGDSEKTANAGQRVTRPRQALPSVPSRHRDAGDESLGRSRRGSEGTPSDPVHGARRRAPR